VEKNSEAYRTAFTISVDVIAGTTTGISAEDRCKTILALADESVQPQDFARPGHIFPLMARQKGVLERPGHTEACVDLLKMAGCTPVGVICEIVNPDHTLMRGEALEAFASKYQLPVLAISELVAYLKSQKTLSQIGQAKLPTEFGDFTIYAYESAQEGVQHAALIYGEVRGCENVLVRIHSECLTGDVFRSLRCDCGLQLQASLKEIAACGQGVLIYLRGQEGRGIGLADKVRAYHLQDLGLDTVEANIHLGLPVDSRDFSSSVAILKDLGISSVRLITNNPKKCEQMQEGGMPLSERVGLKTFKNETNYAYLKTKKEKLGHFLDLEDDNGSI
jgi:3,4-dihydroxy 2-butanone 4-phosphate synthase/GTP cyclohydrolase II